MVSPKVLSSQRSPRPPLHGHDGSAKSNLKDLVVANVSSSQDGKAKSATIEDKPSKSSHATTTPSLAPRKAKSDIEQQVGGKHKQQEAQSTKPSKSAPIRTLWIKANPINLDSQFYQQQMLRRQDLGVLLFMPTT